MALKNQAVQLNNDETAIIGYGSLLSIPSITKTLGREYERPFIHCQLKCWRRTWNITMPNKAFYYMESNTRIYPDHILYLNVYPDPDSQINCVLFVVKRDELEVMHDREWIYEPMDVTSNLIGTTVEGGQALIYSGREEYLKTFTKSTHDVALRASYLRILNDALHKVDFGFRKEFEASTEKVPKHLIIEDLLDPNRPNPWASAGRIYNPDLNIK